MADFAPGAHATHLLIFVVEQNLVEISAVMLGVFCRHYYFVAVRGAK